MAAAVSSARSTSHGPGNLLPSHTSDAVRLATTLGEPARSMVPDSVMPGFPWYFEIVDRQGVPDGIGDYVLAPPGPFLPAGKVALPRREALDLVAYLQSLRQE